MTMRDEDRVEPLDLRPQSLLAEVDGSIDEDLGFVMFEKDRDSETLIARVFGEARFTVTADRRNTRRSTCTEKCKLHKEWTAEILACLRVSFRVVSCVSCFRFGGYISATLSDGEDQPRITPTKPRVKLQTRQIECEEHEESSLV